MTEIIDMQSWKDSNMLLYDPCIDGDEYLVLTVQNALEARGLKSTRGAILAFQQFNGLINIDANNAGVIDIPTFLKLIDVFDDFTKKPILAYLNNKIDMIYGEASKVSFIDRVKNFVHNLFIKNEKF